MIIEKIRTKARSIAIASLIAIAAGQTIVGTFVDLMFSAIGIGIVWVIFKLKL